MISEERIGDFLERYVNGRKVIGIGSSRLGELFAVKLALMAEEKGLQIEFVPTSAKMALLFHEMKVKTVSLNEKEIELAFEFAGQVDFDFNYSKTDSRSLIRDKMIAQSAAELIVIANNHDFVKKINGIILMEITEFGWKRTLSQLEAIGKTELKKIKGNFVRTESGNLIAEVTAEPIYNLEEIEFSAKQIPGVIETGLFIGYADRIVLCGKQIEVKSRLQSE